MKTQAPWTVLGFMVGIGLGCATTAAVSDDAAAEGAAPGVEASAAPQAMAPQVVGPEQATRRYAPAGKAVASLYVKGANASVGHLEMAPNAGVPEHRDPTEEYIFILEGSGQMMIDDQAYEVGPGTAIFMPANARVSFKNGEQTLKAVQVFAGPGPEAKFLNWSAEPTAP